MNIAYIQVTRHCNQRCVFCSNPPRDATLTPDEVRGAAARLRDAGYTGLMLTGGEPTVHPHIARIVSTVKKLGFETRIITNGQKTAEKGFLKQLADAGLDSLTVSLYSSRESVQDELAGVAGSFDNIRKTLHNTAELGIPVSVATTINARNADHLHDTAAWVLAEFPRIRHFVWNNLDPFTDRVAANPGTVPGLWQFEISLYKAMRLLQERGITFRVERVPLCFMAEFAHCSTETRKIVKEEERSVLFLDEKGLVRQHEFQYGKPPVCAACFLNGICAGLFAMGAPYDPDELFPVFLSRENVMEKITGAHESVDALNRREIEL